MVILELVEGDEVKKEEPKAKTKKEEKSKKSKKEDTKKDDNVEKTKHPMSKEEFEQFEKNISDKKILKEINKNIEKYWR